MKKRIACTALALCLCLSLLPAPALAAEEAGGGGVGYVVAPTLSLDEVTEFHDGVAAVRAGQKWAYINSSGQFLTQFKYDFAAPFHEGKGLCAVTTEESRTLLDENGYTPEDEDYNAEMYLYYVDTAGTQHNIPYEDGDPNGTCFVSYRELSQERTRFVNGYLPLHYFYLGPDGKVHKTGSYHDEINSGLGLISAYPMTEGLMGCIVEAIGWYPTVYMDGNGELALNLLRPELFGPVMPDKSVDWQETGVLLHQSFRQVRQIRPFHQGLAPALQTTYDLSTDTETGGWGFIDQTGSFVIPPQYESFMVRDANVTYQVFCGGVAMVKDGNGHWGGIDKNGKTVIPFQYEAADIVSEGIVAVQKNGKWGGVDTTGKLVVPFDYDSVFTFNEGVARVESGGKYGFVDATGKLVIPCIYDEADNACFEGMIWVNQDGKEGYVDATGQVVIPLEFDGVYRFYDGVAFVRNTEGKWGIIAHPDNAVANIVWGGYSNGKQTRVVIKNIGNTHVQDEVLLLFFLREALEVYDQSKGNVGFEALGVYYPLYLDLKPGEVFDSQYSPQGNFVLTDRMVGNVICFMNPCPYESYLAIKENLDTAGLSPNFIPANEDGRNMMAQFITYEDLDRLEEALS